MKTSYGYNIEGKLVNEGVFIPKAELEMLLIKIELLKWRKLKLPDNLLEELAKKYLELEKLEKKIKK